MPEITRTASMMLNVVAAWNLVTLTRMTVWKWIGNELDWIGWLLVTFTLSELGDDEKYCTVDLMWRDNYKRCACQL